MRKVFLSVLILMLPPVTAGFPTAFAQEAAFTLKTSAEMKDIWPKTPGSG